MSQRPTLKTIGIGPVLIANLESQKTKTNNMKVNMHTHVAIMIRTGEGVMKNKQHLFISSVDYAGIYDPANSVPYYYFPMGYLTKPAGSRINYLIVLCGDLL